MVKILGWSTERGATNLGSSRDSASGGEESEHSEGNDSIVHWRDDVAVLVTLVDILCESFILAWGAEKI